MMTEAYAKRKVSDNFRKHQAEILDLYQNHQADVTTAQILKKFKFSSQELYKVIRENGIPFRLEEGTFNAKKQQPLATRVMYSKTLYAVGDKFETGGIVKEVRSTKELNKEYGVFC